MKRKATGTNIQTLNREEDGICKSYISVFVTVTHPDDRVVHLQIEQESGQFAGVVDGSVRRAGSPLVADLAPACTFCFANGGNRCFNRHIGTPAIDQQLAKLDDGRYRHRVGNGHLDQYAGARLETEPFGGSQRRSGFFY